MIRTRLFKLGDGWIDDVTMMVQLPDRQTLPSWFYYCRLWLAAWLLLSSIELATPAIANNLHRSFVHPIQGRRGEEA
jgi:hypothetical protein